MGLSDSPAAIKRLGQNFLIDPNIVRKIVALAEVNPHDRVLEIGPGRGILTEALCRQASHVTAVEIDPRLHAYLAEQAQFPNLTLILADALTYPLTDLQPNTIVVANLPYYLSTPLLFRLLAHHTLFPRLVLMLQEEVVDRLVAKPGSSDYGVLSIMAQYAADITKAFKVSSQCFRPRPEVGSAVALLRIKQQRALTQEDEGKFSALVKSAFVHRRKTLINSLKDEGYDHTIVNKALLSLHLPVTTRAEVLSIAQFIALTHALTSNSVPTSQDDKPRT